jgi:hypothetical protein
MISGKDFSLFRMRKLENVQRWIPDDVIIRVKSMAMLDQREWEGKKEKKLIGT